jgi:TolB-like protein
LGDPRQTYFADGITEELREALARLPKLTVIARPSSEALRGAGTADARAG